MDRTPALPDQWSHLTGQVLSAERDQWGCNTEVHLLTAERGRFILKVAQSPEQIGLLRREQGILQALAPYRPWVPAPLAATVDGQTGLFLLTCLDGANMAEALQQAGEPRRHALVAEFGRALARIHGWTPALPRPENPMTVALQSAERAIAAGTADYPAGADPGELLANLARWSRGITPGTAFCHLDYCLPNVMVQRDRASGIIDWSQGGWSDPRLDLAAGLWTIHYNLGEGTYGRTFLSAYGFSGSPADLSPWMQLWRMMG